MIFEQLVMAILKRELLAEEKLPPERVLAERFGTTRIIVRQAIHKLADLGLVEVRQGSATKVCDLTNASDIRLVELLYKYGPRSEHAQAILRNIVEKQYLQGLCMIELASLRATPEDRAEILRITQDESPQSGGEAEVTEFEERFWTAVAAAGQNRIYRIEIAWWYRIFIDDHPRPALVKAAPLTVRISFYRELAERLAKNDAPVRFYMDTIRPMLTMLAQAAITSGGRGP